MTITCDFVEAYLKCPTKCFLLSLGEVGRGNPYAEWTRMKSAHFRSDGIQRLVPGLASEQCVTSVPETESLPASKWPLAIDAVARGNNPGIAIQSS